MEIGGNKQIVVCYRYAHEGDVVAIELLDCDQIIVTELVTGRHDVAP